MIDQPHNQIRSFVYPRGMDDIEGPSELREISIVAKPTVLLHFSAHLNSATDVIDLQRQNIGQPHLRDTRVGWQREDAEIVVVAPEPSV